jgi:hypothetical protein
MGFLLTNLSMVLHSKNFKKRCLLIISFERSTVRKQAHPQQEENTTVKLMILPRQFSNAVVLI